MSDFAWCDFQRATELYQRSRSAESAANMLAAYERWVRGYVPAQAEILIAEFRDKLARSQLAA